MSSIKKAREVWRLKLGGANIRTMARALSTTSEIIKKIIKYTVHEHYASPTQAPSYYDDKLSIEQKILSEKKKIKKATASIAQKKKILYIMLEATVLIVFIFIAI